MSHTTHHACQEMIDKYGGKTIGCCCTGHKCADFAYGETLSEPTYSLAVIAEWLERNARDLISSDLEKQLEQVKKDIGE